MNMTRRTTLHLVVVALFTMLVTGPQVTADELEVVKDLKWKHEDADVAGLRRVMFTADGKTLATAGYECVRLWDITGDEPKQRSAATKIGDLGRHGLWDMAISPDGRLVA